MAKINNKFATTEKFETTITDVNVYHDWIYDVAYVLNCAVSGLNSDTNEYYGIGGGTDGVTQIIKTVNGRRIFMYRNNANDFIGRKLIIIVQKQ